MKHMVCMACVLATLILQLFALHPVKMVYVPALIFVNVQWVGLVTDANMVSKQRTMAVH